MAYFEDNDVYMAFRRIFATTFFDNNLGDSKYRALDKYMFLSELKDHKWSTLFNHFEPDIDYNATIVVTKDGSYYNHEHNYMDVDVHKTKHRLFIDSVVEVYDGNNVVRISFGRKYRYTYS